MANLSNYIASIFWLRRQHSQHPARLQALRARQNPQSSAAVSVPSYPNASAHLAEIARRNLLRQESGLPLISIPKELRRIKTAEASATFAKFSEALRSRVQEKMLARVRRRIGDPSWKPNGSLSGMAFEYEVSRELRKLYEPDWVKDARALIRHPSLADIRFATARKNFEPRRNVPSQPIPTKLLLL